MSSTLKPEELLRLERSVYDAMVKRDSAALDRLVHDSVTYTHSNGRMEDKQKFLDTILKDRQYTSVDSAFVQSKEMPGVAVLTSKITLNAEGRPPNNIQQCQVWSEFSDGWKLVFRGATKA